MKLPSEEIQRLLKQVVEHFDKEDRAIRERQIITWRHLKFLWEGFSQIYYSELAHDWRIADHQQADDDQSYYDKPINVFRAYLESIIAALSTVVPPIKCYPDDADNTLDLSTARAGDKIAQLIFRHNNAPFLWIHALFIYCTEGMVACYNYSKEDKEYGTYQEKKYENREELIETTSCPQCGYRFEEKPVTETTTNIPGPEVCPECDMMEIPEIKQNIVTRTELVGITDKPKSRQIMEVYGGLYVKVPNYAKKQEDCPYLIFSYETHYANARARYPHIRSKIGPSSGGDYEPYERWGRLSPQYQGEYPVNNVTCRNVWLRPESFEVLEEEDAKKLNKLYPKGASVVLVNEEFAEAKGESLDDCWTLTHNPLSDYLHHDPLGLLLTSVQEITNDIVSLALQTIEHGIPQTFADPNVLSFNAYGQTEVRPGMISPAAPKSGKSVGDAFYEVKTATLSGEVLPFFQQIQGLGQLVSGALPSLFGGQMDGSKTASEYSMSRAQALQRLQSTWKTFVIWWKVIFGKAIPAYIKDVQEDERFVDKDENGNFINVVIRKAELEGKIGNIELEANENLPITYNQIRDIIMQLLESNNPEIQAILMTPENLPLIREAIGLTDFMVPGEDDRNAEYDEIKQLLNSEPLLIPPDPMMIEQAVLMGQPLPEETEQPSVEVDPILDNHQIRFEINRKWLIGETGRLAKTENPAGYKNVLLHSYQHFQFMQQAMVEAQGAQQTAKPNKDREAPIKEERNVPVQQ